MRVSQENTWFSGHGARKSNMWRGVAFVLLSVLGILAQQTVWLPFGVGLASSFSPAQILQVVGSVWCGVWGVLAGSAAPLFANLLANTSLGSGAQSWSMVLALVPAHLLRSGVACWAFRRFRADPRLRAGRDWFVWGFFGVGLSNALGSLASVGALYILGELATDNAYVMAGELWHLFSARFLSQALSTWFLGTLLLKFLSPLVVLRASPLLPACRIARD